MKCGDRARDVDEVILVGMLPFHALNGVRIIIDFWPETTAAHRKWTYAMATVFGLIFVPTAICMLEWVIRQGECSRSLTERAEVQPRHATPKPLSC